METDGTESEEPDAGEGADCPDSASGGEDDTDSEDGAAPDQASLGAASAPLMAPIPRSMPALGFGGWRGNWTSISRASKGSGRKGRITSEDVKAALAGRRGGGAGAGIPGLEVAPWPQVDFAKYGEVERVPLSRIKRISGPNLARNWVMIPHVTHDDEADITDLEAFRKQVNSEQDVKVTMVALLIKACVGALRQFPEFNSSLDGDELVIKRYYNLGFAADTPQGLLVPVISDADRKGLLEIAAELRELSGKAREGKISAEEMRGRDVHDLLAGRDRRHRLHPDRQRARGGDPRRHPLGRCSRSGTARSSSRG